MKGNWHLTLVFATSLKVHKDSEKVLSLIFSGNPRANFYWLSHGGSLSLFLETFVKLIKFPALLLFQTTFDTGNGSLGLLSMAILKDGDFTQGLFCVIHKLLEIWKPLKWMGSTIPIWPWIRMLLETSELFIATNPYIVRTRRRGCCIRYYTKVLYITRIHNVKFRRDAL